jgi:outer membrane receptor protein involved in Fe transport
VTLSGAPEGYKPDKTVNYEVGVKGEAFERKLTFEASIYRIDWNDLQLVVTPPSLLSYYTNAGKAKSQGVELSMQARPTRGLKLSSWVAYNDAKLAENFPAELTALGLAGVEGDRVPDSVEWSGHFSIDQDFAITDNVTSFVGGMVSYVGERLGVYVVSGSPRQQYPSYTQADLRAGVRFNDWNVNVFANNVTDKRAVLLGDPNLVTAVNYNQPRTVGVSFAKSF